MTFLGNIDKAQEAILFYYGGDLKSGIFKGIFTVLMHVGSHTGSIGPWRKNVFFL